MNRFGGESNVAESNGAGAWPHWILEDVLPTMSERVRHILLFKESGALVFAETHLVVAEKGTFGKPKLNRVDYPPGLLVNAARCPHCGELIQEPTAKVAHLAVEKRGKKKPAKRKSR